MTSEKKQLLWGKYLERSKLTSLIFNFYSESKNEFMRQEEQFFQFPNLWGMKTLWIWDFKYSFAEDVCLKSIVFNIPFLCKDVVIDAIEGNDMISKLENGFWVRNDKTPNIILNRFHDAFEENIEEISKINYTIK